MKNKILDLMEQWMPMYPREFWRKTRAADALIKLSKEDTVKVLQKVKSKKIHAMLNDYPGLAEIVFVDDIDEAIKELQ